jgi:hypothetical protein
VTICGAAGNQLISDVIDDGNGGAIVTWVDHRGTTDDIYAQRVDATGAPQWTANGVPVCTATGAQRSPRLASDGAGGCIVSWQDERISSQNPNIFVQRLDDTGAPQLGVNGSPVCNDGGIQTGPAITADGLGGAIIFLTDLRGGPTAPAVFAQRVDATGTPQFAANGLNVLAMQQFGGRVSGAVAAPGNAIVLTNQFLFDFGNNTITSELVAQKINGVGAAQWGAAGAIVVSNGSFIVYEHMVEDGFGGAIVGWSDSRNGTFDIFAQRLNPPDGAPMWTANGVTVSNAASYQQLGSVTHDSNGNSFYVWADQRGGQPDVYAQQLNFLTGAPQWTANGTRVCGASRGQYLPSLGRGSWRRRAACSRRGPTIAPAPSGTCSSSASTARGSRSGPPTARRRRCSRWWPPTPTRIASGSSGTRRRTSQRPCIAPAPIRCGPGWVTRSPTDRAASRSSTPRSSRVAATATRLA